MFDKEILSQLKCENGGLQTVLKNCGDVFCGKFILRKIHTINVVINLEECSCSCCTREWIQVDRWF